MNDVVDLRSDTVTKPSAAMRRAMAEAEVGDDVYREDPTVNRLQDRAAEIFGREAALFVSSGTMGNLIALKVHTQPGQEIIAERRAHIYNYEMASAAAIAGCMVRPVDAEDGLLDWTVIAPEVRSRSDHRARTGLVSLENTSNLAGGSVYPAERMEEICAQAHARGIPVHLDGARIFNAACVLGKPVKEITCSFDSVMFCLSKGLGAPVGSLLVGSKEFFEEARQVRKLLGGGMRQAGVLAAAGLLALEDGPRQFPEDHTNARFLAAELAEIPGVAIDPAKVVSNILFFDVRSSGFSAKEVVARLASLGVLANTLGEYSVRFVTHRDVDHADCERAVCQLKSVMGARPHAPVA